MGISIKNADIEADIRALAELTGQSVTQAVGDAVREKLTDERAAARKVTAAQWAHIDALVADLKTLPVRDAREHGDMLYDRDGAPK